MSRRVNIISKLHPNDFNKPYGSLGIKLPMNTSGKTDLGEFFNLSYTTEEQAISNFVNLLLTKPGERYMQPNFGVGLWLYVFENITDRFDLELEERIRSQASLWLPYIFIQDIELGSRIDVFGNEHTYNIHIKFNVTESGANRTIIAFVDGEQDFNLEVE